MARRAIRPHLKGLLTWTLALSQAFWVVGCRQTTGPGRSTASGSTAAASTAGVNIGKIVYDVLRHGYEGEGEAGKVAALDSNRDAFIGAINQILPANTSQGLFPTLLSLLPLVDDGSVEAAVADADAVLVDLLQDSTTLDALVRLMASQPGANTRPSDNRTLYLLVNRLLAYPETDKVAQALFELLRAHDGVDDQGNPNGERNLLAELQGVVSRQLLAFRAGPATGQNLTQILLDLSDALLAGQPLKAFPDLGAPAWSVRHDVNGNPRVVADPATSRLPLPFVDRDADGVADVDASGQAVDGNGQPIAILPFGEDGTRDSYGRALAPGGGLYFDYFDAKRTLLGELLLLIGQLLEKDVPGRGLDLLKVLIDRVRNDNGTPGDLSDDFETLSADSPVIDLAWSSLELVEHTPLPDLLKGLAELERTNPARFGDMLDALMVAVKHARGAAQTTPPPAGANQALINDLLPMLEAASRPRGQNTSALRALLQAFNSEQRRLRNLPASMANMMRWHDYRQRIPADATHASALQRVLEMMGRANGCSAPGISNMADFYLDAMAGNARILGINISIGTINQLLDIGFLRSLLCSAIRPEDVRALKDFNDTGLLAAMKPIAKVFSDRGETSLLRRIMLALGTHYDRAMRPTEPLLIAVMDSGAVEKLFEVLDGMTTVRIPGSTEVVADVLADTLTVLLDPGTPRFDRRGRSFRSLLTLLLDPMDRLSAQAQARQVGPQLDALISSALDVLLSTYMDDNGTPANAADDVERWTWSSLKVQLGEMLDVVASTLPADAAGRATWVAQTQFDTERLLTGRDVVAVIDLFAAVAASPQKQALNAGIANLFTPRANASDDAMGAILILLAEHIQHQPAAAGNPIDSQALETVLHFAGRELDPALKRFDDVGRLLLRIIALDNGLFLLNVLRNAVDLGPTGAGTPPIEVLRDVFSQISAAGGSGPTTVADLQASLQKTHDFINDTQSGLPTYIQRIKSRAR